MSLSRLSNRSRRQSGRTLPCRLRLELLESRLAPATHTWTGASTTSFNWSDAANWSGGAPHAGESSVALIFPGGLSVDQRIFMRNDIVGLTVTSIQITGQSPSTDPGYVLQGNAITLAGPTSITVVPSPGVTGGGASSSSRFNCKPSSSARAPFFDHVFDVQGTASLEIERMTGPPLLNFLHKTGSGTLGLAGPDDFGGATQIDGGTLRLDGDNILPVDSAVTVAVGATLDLIGHDASLGSLSGAGRVINSYGPSTPPLFSTLTTGVDDTSTTFSGVITGNINLIKDGTGTFTLGDAQSFAGTIAVTQGTLAQGIDNGIPTFAEVEVDQGATLDLSGHDTTLAQFTGAGTVTSSSSATLFLSLISNDTFDGVITGNISLDVTTNGNPTFTLNGVNTFTGSLSIHSGTVAEGVDFAIPPVAVEVDGGATLDLNGHQADLGSLSGSGTVIYDPLPILVTLTTGLDNTSTEFDGVISGNINLVKAGTGTFTLGGANTYAGSRQSRLAPWPKS